MKYLLSFCLFINFIYGQTPNELGFVQVTKDIVFKFSKADSVGLLDYIDRETGIYILFRNGTEERYQKLNAISYSDHSFPNFPFYKNIKYTTLLFESSPIYNCDSFKWNKHGTFVDTLNKDQTLTQLLKSMETFDQVKVPSITVSTFQDIEKNGRRVIISDVKGNELIIYLIFNNNKWHLTVIDFLTTDCST